MSPRHTTKQAASDTPCYYGCGRKAYGSLNVSFTSFSESPSSYKEGFSAYIPSCRECLKGALTVTITLPKESAIP